MATIRSSDFDDDTFEYINGKKCVRDGHQLRVPVYLMDGALDPLQRAVAASGVRVTDAFGGDTMGSRPGWRIGVEDGSGSSIDALSHHRRVSGAAMYQTYDAEISQRWRGEDADEDLAPGTPYVGAEGQACTINGFPGRLVKGKDGELFCRPIAADSVIDNCSEEDNCTIGQVIHDHQINMARIYAEIDAEISRAWRQT
jgi:hypothetical protein